MTGRCWLGGGSLHPIVQVSSYSKLTVNSVLLIYLRLNEDIFIPG